ncbi:hypothetical protein M0804_011406 [Polistes exclamans]|nr:hypothetical protein M0804_011406 [Polistes exclamans]
MPGSNIARFSTNHHHHHHHYHYHYYYYHTKPYLGKCQTEDVLMSRIAVNPANYTVQKEERETRNPISNRQACTHTTITSTSTNSITITTTSNSTITITTNTTDMIQLILVLVEVIIVVGGVSGGGGGVGVDKAKYIVKHIWIRIINDIMLVITLSRLSHHQMLQKSFLGFKDKNLSHF